MGAGSPCPAHGEDQLQQTSQHPREVSDTPCTSGFTHLNPHFVMGTKEKVRTATRAVETINAESMWKRLPHSAWKIVMLKYEMLWAPVLNRHTALTLLSWLFPNQSPRQKLFGEGKWSQGAGAGVGMEKDEIGDIGMREIQLRVVLLSWVLLGTPARSYLGTL